MKNETWPEIADIATGHAQEYLAIWPPYTLRKRMAEVKQNENRATSGLPRTGAVIWSSSRKFPRQLLFSYFLSTIATGPAFHRRLFSKLASYNALCHRGSKSNIASQPNFDAP